MVNLVPSNFNIPKLSYNSFGVVQNSNAHYPSLSNNPVRLSVYSVNDMHNNIDNMSGMIALSDKFDNEAKEANIGSIKISAGDNVSGADEKKNKLTFDVISKRMGLDYIVPGNHELDGGLTNFLKLLSESKINCVATNALVPDNCQFYNYVKKSAITEINGEKYGIVGLMPFDLITVTGDERKLEGLRVQDLEESAKSVNNEVNKLKGQGINKFIMISHIGFENDQKIAPLLNGIDFIIGGHSHTEVNGIREGVNLFKNADGDPVIISQTGENARNIGILNLEFSPDGVIVNADNKLIGTNQEKNPAIDYIKNKSLGDSPVVGSLDAVDGLPKNRRKAVCAWTNMLADAMRYETGVDIAFVNAANTRKVPKKGQITQRDIMESSPMKNILCVKKMTEKEVVRAIKESLSATFSNESGEPGILHCSGLSYIADDKGKLYELSFTDKNGQKTPIDIANPTDKAYSVIYDSFLLSGTEYPVFAPENMTYKETDKIFDFDKDKLAIDYLSKRADKNNLKITDDKRIVIKSENAPETDEPKPYFSELLNNAIKSKNALDTYSKIA